MGKSKWPIYFLLLLLFAACEADETGDVAPAELIRAVTVAVQPDNVLRVEVSLDFKKSVSYQIEYWKAGDESSVRTTKSSEPVTSDKCVLLLLKAQTEYNFRVMAHTGEQSVVSDVYKFTTGILPARIPLISLLNDQMAVQLPGYILLTRSNENPGSLILTDTEGTVVWYQLLDKVLSVATFDAKTNTIACIVGKHPTHPYAGNEVLVMDLYGNVLLHKEIPELFPHHEIRRLSNGDLLMVHYTPEKFDLSVQGGGKEETVYGDGLLVMDMSGKIKWEWDCFGEMNPADDPKIMENIEQLNFRYCDDWLHANSADMDEDGNFYITFNWLSQLWKVDAKTKKVLYRLGTGGNVELPSNGYMEGTHCVSALSKNQVLLFDNGMQSHKSRGLLFTIDEATRRAKLTRNIILPSEYSSQYQGSVTFITDNLFMFGPTFSSAVLFTDAEGTILRTIKTMNQSYRAGYVAKISLVDE